MKEKNKQKQGGSRVGDTIKMDWIVGSVKTKKSVVLRWKISKAATGCNRRAASRVDCYIMLIASAKIPEREGSILPSSFYG